MSMSNAELFAFIKKNPISIGCGVLSLLLAVGIYYRSGLLPDAEADLTQKSSEAERYDANLKNAVQLKEQLDALVTASKEIDRRVVHAGQKLSNDQYFYKLESESGAKLTTLSQSTLATARPAAKATFMPVGFSVTVQGSLAQLLDFLRRLESGAHYCRVMSASCGGGGNGATTLTLNLSVEILGLP